MQPCRDYRRIGIWGFGREGKANYAYLLNRFPQADFVVLSDEPCVISEGLSGLFGAAARQAIVHGEFDLIAKSPAISLYRPEVALAREQSTHFTTSTNLWFERYPAARSLAVTGTKGKTTTAGLIHFMLSRAGADVALGGNIGVPLLDVSPGKDLTVIELSSAQIADLSHCPDIIVIVNLFPEHTDWHGSVEQYYSDKTRLLDLNPAPLAVLNRQCAESRARFENRPDVRWFNDERGFRVAGDALFHQGRRLSFGWKLKGAHNLSNLAAAMTAIEVLGIDPIPLLRFLPDFRAAPHRLEEIGTRNGVLFVDDSISTTPASTSAAVRVYADRTIALILGGYDRGLDYEPLARILGEVPDIRVLTVPDNGPRIAESVRRISPRVPVIECSSLAAAVKSCTSAVGVRVVLLSPAAASYGLFSNYEERGKAFARAAGFATTPDTGVLNPHRDKSL